MVRMRCGCVVKRRRDDLPPQCRSKAVVTVSIGRRQVPVCRTHVDRILVILGLPLWSYMKERVSA